MPNRNINIIVEDKVPYVRGVLDPYATVRYLPPEAITPKEAETADAMIIRTRTVCDKALLERSPCKIIATATIGLDHIDLDYCAGRGITVVNAPGCNAPAVAQYVFASLLHTVNRPLRSMTLGIVGAGHVGGIVDRWAKSMGIRTLVCDPPRQRAEGGDGWASMEDIAREADIVTFHTPLTSEGPDATYHLCGEEFLSSLRRAPIIINSARGAVVDTAALNRAADKGLVGPLIIDCWEGEPDIDGTLLRRAAIATPHIAGYSAAGKARASQQALDAVTTLLMMPRVDATCPMPPAVPKSVRYADILATYDPAADSARLKENPENFELLRNSYTLREEVPEGSDD